MTYPCRTCPLEELSEGCHAKAVRSPRLCSLVREREDYRGLVRRLTTGEQAPPPRPAPPPPAPIGEQLALIMACPKRGPVIEGPRGCGCAPRRRCADGRDVTLIDCLACVSRPRGVD